MIEEVIVCGDCGERCFVTASHHCPEAQCDGCGKYVPAHEIQTSSNRYSRFPCEGDFCEECRTPQHPDGSTYIIPQAAVVFPFSIRDYPPIPGGESESATHD